MKNIFSLSYFVLLCVLSHAQGRYDANWCFGYHAGIDFSDTSNPFPFRTNCNNIEAAACMSDSIGILQLYYASGNATEFDYGSIRNYENDIIANGDSLFVHPSCTNGCVILPIGNTLFFLQIWIDSLTGIDNRLYCSKLSAAPSTTLISKNSLIFNHAIEEKLATTRHANGRDWWVVTHQRATDTVGICNNRFYVFLLKEDTIIGPIIQDVGSEHCYFSDNVGQSLFSNNGNILISTVFFDAKVDILFFNRCSGMLSLANAISLPDSIYPYGAALNKDNRYLYISSGSGGFGGEAQAILQYQLDSNYQTNGYYKLKDDSLNGSLLLGQLKLAPNNKVYIPIMDEDFWSDSNRLTFHNRRLSVIEQPDSAGLACSFNPFSFDLGDSARNYFSLPNMPNYNLGPLSTIWQTGAGKDTFICANQDSIVKGVPLGGDSIAGVTTTWEPGPDIYNIHRLYQVVYPTQSRWYHVTFSDTTIVGSCQSREDSVYVEVRVCDGVSEFGQAKFEIYPNPASTYLTVSSPTECTLSLYNMLGQRIIRKVMSQGLNGLDIAAFPTGIYSYSIDAESLHQTGKLIIAR